MPFDSTGLPIQPSKPVRYSPQSLLMRTVSCESAKEADVPEIKLLRQVFEKVKGYSSASVHEDSFYSIGHARNKGMFEGKKDVVLMNIDSHSDLYTMPAMRTRWTSGSWMNGVILDNPQITEVIWVRPAEIEASAQKEARKRPRLNEEHQHPVYHCPTRQIYVDVETQQIVYQPPPPKVLADPKRYRILTVHFVTEDQLPDLKNRDVVMSIDMDYFHNTGHDTIDWVRVPFKEMSGFCALFQKLAAAHIQPFLLTTAISPDYSFSLNVFDFSGLANLWKRWRKNWTPPLKVTQQAIYKLADLIGSVFTPKL